ncbi:15594_t:CDS:2 [Dentiscutata heterogama]|uniref:15594_t:CDS:1 n=1 Tax=Dentiscutata heterogama TaxID=1316150 RepID=A0ACA9KQL3_9GLOM|nr:15594_t:CDS:2 [Dentiscutata heterogama]
MSAIIKDTLYVKPTRPTKHVQIPLSNCDIIMPPVYQGLIYFFKNDLKKDNFMNIKKLLESLGDVLNDYYPLAGTLKSAPDGRSIIDCNDQGVQFIIAECSDITINQLEEKNWEHAATPYGLTQLSSMAKIDPFISIIQHTTFADGSVALGLGIHHQVVDGFGLFTFIENWGRRARLEQIDPPIHDRSLLKASGNPPTNVPSEYTVLKPTENISSRSGNPSPLTTKIFRFSQDVLKRLRDYYSFGIPNGSWISTNDALVAHLWRTTTRARNIDLSTEIFCSFALNGRDRLNIPKNYYGNVALQIYPKMLVSQLINGSPSSVALQVRKAVTDMNESRIRSIIDWIEQQPDKSLVVASCMHNAEDLVLTNWAKFHKHDLIDFGDGTPIKQRMGRKFAANGLYIIFGVEDGIEVYISLQTDKLEILEQDPEFKKFIS